jgi:hypothetical protein
MVKHDKCDVIKVLSGKTNEKGQKLNSHQQIQLTHRFIGIPTVIDKKVRKARPNHQSE